MDFSSEKKPQFLYINVFFNDFKVEALVDSGSSRVLLVSPYEFSAYIRCMSLLETQLTFRTRQKFSRPIPVAFSLVMTSTFTFKTVRTDKVSADKTRGTGTVVRGRIGKCQHGLQFGKETSIFVYKCVF
jgi:hypothetical protein